MSESDHLLAEWKVAHPYDFGKAILEPLTSAERVARCLSVLDVSRSRWKSIPEVEAVAAVARAPDRWREGRRLFDAVRGLSLQEDKHPTNSVYEALLFIAETAAQTAYNASNPADPFDPDCSWWLSPCAREMVGAVCEPAFEERVWRALAGR